MKARYVWAVLTENQEMVFYPSSWLRMDTGVSWPLAIFETKKEAQGCNKKFGGNGKVKRILIQ